MGLQSALRRSSLSSLTVPFPSSTLSRLCSCWQYLICTRIPTKGLVFSRCESTHEDSAVQSASKDFFTRSLFGPSTSSCLAHRRYSVALDSGTTMVIQYFTRSSTNGSFELGNMSRVRRSSTKGIIKVHIPLTPKRWKKGMPSTEVVNAVTALRRVKENPHAIKEVLKKIISRMLKLETLQVVAELQRLDEWALTLQVFNFVKGELWYRPDVYLYQTLIQTLGRAKQIKEVQRLWKELQKVGLKPDPSIHRDYLRAFVFCGMNSHAIEIYKKILDGGPDQAARSILFHGLNEEEKAVVTSFERELNID